MNVKVALIVASATWILLNIFFIISFGFAVLFSAGAQCLFAAFSIIIGIAIGAPITNK